MPFVSCSGIKSDTTSHVMLAKAKEVHRARVWENSSILCVLGSGEKSTVLSESPEIKGGEDSM